MVLKGGSEEKFPMLTRRQNVKPSKPMELSKIQAGERRSWVLFIETLFFNKIASQNKNMQQKLVKK